MNIQISLSYPTQGVLHLVSSTLVDDDGNFSPHQHSIALETSNTGFFKDKHKVWQAPRELYMSVSLARVAPPFEEKHPL